jgi:hypothetical protein
LAKSTHCRQHITSIVSKRAQPFNFNVFTSSLRFVKSRGTGKKSVEPRAHNRHLALHTG